MEKTEVIALYSYKAETKFYVETRCVSNKLGLAPSVMMLMTLVCEQVSVFVG